MTQEKTSTPSAHWRRRSARAGLPADEAVRQGDITRLAFLSLGKDAAIAFLNTEDAELGGRPLALATASADGAVRVRAKVRQLAVGTAGEDGGTGT